MNGNVEIFKEGCGVSEKELALIKSVAPNYYSYENRANGYTAFAVFGIDRDSADSLVDSLNDGEDGHDANGYGKWFLGDEEEEYVFVD